MFTVCDVWLLEVVRNYADYGHLTLNKPFRVYMFVMALHNNSFIYAHISALVITDII